MTASASPDHFCSPARKNSTLRTLHSVSAAISAAVRFGQSILAIALTSMPKISSSLRISLRRISVRSVLGTGDNPRMTTPPTLHNPVMISIALQTQIRNCLFFLCNLRARPTTVECAAKSNLSCDGRMTPVSYDTTSAKNTSGVSHGGTCQFPDERSCVCAFGLDRIQIRSQFVPGHAGNSLDLEHSQWRDRVPLRNGLLGDAERGRQFGEAACILNSAFKR